MKKARLKSLLLVVLSIVMTVSVITAVGCNQSAVVNANVVTLEDSLFEASYKHGSKLEVSATYAVSDAITAKDGTIEFPNGKIYNAGTMTLSELGLYTIRYYYNDNAGTLTTYVITFEVKQPYYELTADNGSSIFASSNKTENGYRTHSGDDAIVVNLKEGCEFKYNKAIDLSKSTKTKLAHGTDSEYYGGLTDIIQIDPRLGNVFDADGNKVAYLPATGGAKWDVETQGSRDYGVDWSGYVNAQGEPSKLTYSALAKNCVITLTDAYNPNVAVNIYYFRNPEAGGWARGRSYFYVGSTTQDAYGICYGNTNTVNTGNTFIGPIEINGKMSTVPLMGGSTGTHPSGYTGVSILDNYNAHAAVKFQYDFENNRVYYTNSKIKTATGEPYSIIMADLSSEAIYGKNTFPGFTTGEVYLSIKLTEYSGDGANVEIMQIGNEKADTLMANVDSTLDNYLDDRAPDIYVDVELTEEPKDGVDGCLFAAVGSKFIIPTAKVYDVNLKGGISTKVYRSYGSNKQYPVTIKDGKIDITDVDVYTIEYTAYDTAGNKAIKTINVKAVTVSDQKGISVNFKDLNELTTFMSTGLVTGKENVLPEFTISNINKKDSLTYEIYAKHEYETIKIDSVKRSFIPKYTGVYTIEFILKDNAYTETKYYQIESKADASVVSILDTPFLLKYYIKGATYSIDEIFAYTFGNDGPQAKKVKTYAIYDGNEAEKVLIEDVNSFVITGNETVQFLFEFNDGTISAVPVYTEVAKIHDVGYGKGNGTTADPEKYMLYKYFKYQEGDFTVDTVNPTSGKELTDITYMVGKQSGDAKLEFVNPISTTEFTFTYKVILANSNFSKLKFTLTSIYNSEDVRTIEIFPGEGSTWISLDGGSPTKLTKYDFGSNSSRKITYDDRVGKLYVGNDNAFVYNLNVEGGLAYMNVELMGVTGKSGITVSNVNNASFKGNVHNDASKPQIAYETSQGRYALGEVVTIKPASFSDVLSPINVKSIVFTVKDPNGGFATATDGTKLDGTADYTKEYSIELKEYGGYAVSWEVQDVAKQKISQTYSITCIDTTAPVITFEDGRNENTMITVKLTEKVKFQYTIDDGNGTAADDCIVYVGAKLIRTDSYTFFDIGNEFYLREYGEWMIFVIAFDKNWNRAFECFYVNVI